jgi:ATP-dependent exoDNAse (exonuclease V) beta subunit
VTGDSAARATALDPRRSFIVQAPAGSGKTELLIQRYLALLATVDEPEQVVAITFTRKAAAEMRRRVLDALRDAAVGAGHGAPHRTTTLELARTVARHDAERGWSLADVPQRLRIDTLDAFNVALARRLPLLAGGVAAATIAEDASDESRVAARRAVSELPADGELGASLRELLRSLDNDQAGLERLLAELLPRREQWLGHLAGRDAAELRAQLELALQRLVGDELEALRARWPAAAWSELAALLTHAARHAAAPDVRQAIQTWLAAPAQSAPAAGLAAWRMAAALLLTKAGDWRRQAPKEPGFGAEHASVREQWRALLAALANETALRDALHGTAGLPEPRYTEPQWRKLAALQTVLVRLVAELKVIFAERRCVDFVELSLAAQRALGASEAPSELLLALDRRIQHLLVDEFQDTSQAQLRLVELLTSGWQRGDGRTLFLVGDPMQSIYRFRDADVSLFLRVQRRGIGAIALESLQLARNFRSAPTVVDWVNRVFATVFPANDDVATGAAAFAPSTAERTSAAQQFVRAHAVDDTDPRAESATVIQILAAERERDSRQSIAVLVQSRTHLTGLQERLAARGWPVHAVEIEAPNEQQIGQDLLGLTRALTHWGDRIAWLGVLRAPWCGLTWRDLHALCHDAFDRTIWDLLNDTARVARLSDDGRARAGATTRVLHRAFAARGTLGLAAWIQDTWQRLDGPACLDDDVEHARAQQFFALLGRHETNGDIVDPAVLEQVFAKAQRQSDPPPSAGIEIMTMHRAKGLEFDTVILLGLAREPRRDDAKALYWLQRANAAAADDLLLAPLVAAGAPEERLASFVRRADRQRDLAERARVLYVAATRARERLHLVCSLAAEDPQPLKHTLLAYLWPHVAADLVAQLATTPAPPATAAAAAIQPVLRRLAVPADAPAPPPELPPEPAPRPEFAWSSRAAVHVGSVVHRHLQQIAEEGIERWSADRVQALAPRLARELELAGVDADELRWARERALGALSAVLDDADGRWLLGAHTESASELRLTLRLPAALRHIQIDRTFVADGIRWIIDFKTGQHEGGDRRAFLDSEVERYRPQLARYAAAFAVLDARPIKLGLYFPLLRAFRSWPAAPQP